MRIVRSHERGFAEHGWLKSFHTFSFADYYNPAMHHFRFLRVINEDWVQPGKGFATHPHQNMEIITYILSGELAHQDSIGNGSVIRPGEVQYMSAGSGVTHSEFNHSDSAVVHLLQIWIFPDRKNTPPRYDQKAFAAADRHGKWRLVVSSDGREESIKILQDASIYSTLIDAKTPLTYDLAAGRSAYIHVAQGPGVKINGESLAAGDAAMLAADTVQAIYLESEHEQVSDVILFDLN